MTTFNPLGSTPPPPPQDPSPSKPIERPPEDASRFTEAMKKGQGDDVSRRGPEKDDASARLLDPRSLFQRPAPPETRQNQGDEREATPGETADQAAMPPRDADAEPLVGQDGKPVIGQDGKPVVGQDGKPLVGQDDKPMAGQDRPKPLVGQDSRPLDDRAPEPTVGQAPRPSVDSAPKPLVGQDAKPLGDEQAPKAAIGQDGRPAIDRDDRPPSDPTDLFRGRMPAPPPETAAAPAKPSDDPRTLPADQDTAAPPPLTAQDLAHIASQAAAPRERPLTDASDLFRGRMPPTAPSGETAPTPTPQTARPSDDLADAADPVSQAQPRHVTDTDDPTDADEPSPPVPSADMILRNMAPQAQAIEQTQAPAAPRMESSLTEMVREVADRILVGESAETGQAEVRITLKDDVLGGTEIRVTENAGAYEITFVAANKDIENFLANRQDQLSTALGERLDREIRIAVTDRDGSPNEQGDQRGRQQDQGQPGDGRSRNQRSVEDERER